MLTKESRDYIVDILMLCDTCFQLLPQVPQAQPIVLQTQEEHSLNTHKHPYLREEARGQGVEREGGREGGREREMWGPGKSQNRGWIERRRERKKKIERGGACGEKLERKEGRRERGREEGERGREGGERKEGGDEKRILTLTIVLISNPQEQRIDLTS